MNSERNDLENVLHRSVLGYYEPGGIPTVVAHPLGGTTSHLTNIHEQAHQDLLVNTVYGYCLRTLIAIRRVPDALDAHERTEQFRALLARCWNLAEGHATILELMAAGATGGDMGFRRLFDRLPDDYRAAVIPFLRFLNERARRWDEPAGALVLNLVIQAVAENALDWSILSREPPPATFDEVVDVLMRGPGPDEALPRLIEAHARVDPERYETVLGAYFTGGQPFTVPAIRTTVGELRSLLMQAADLDPNPMIRDENRIRYLNHVNDQLVRSHPGLPEIVSGDAGARVRVVHPAPQAHLEEAEVDADGFARTIAWSASIEGYAGTVVQVLRNPATGLYAASSVNVTVREGTLDLSGPNPVCRDIPREAVSEIDGRLPDLVWLTALIWIDHPPFIYDLNFLRGLKGEVYLLAHPYRFDRLPRLIEILGPDVTLALCWVPGGEGLEVLHLRCGRLNVFSVVPQRFVPDQVEGIRVRRMSILDVGSLVAVYRVFRGTDSSQWDTDA